jgi:hypothetical protein
MPYLNFGEELSFSKNTFIKLSGKNDQLHFRLLGTAYYEGKHFIKKADGKWEVLPCQRINTKQGCEYCKLYFEHLEEALKVKDTSKKEYEALKKEADKYKAAISIYYPVLNRKTETFQIFETKMGIRKKIEAELAAGIPVLERDFIVTRTENPGADYYTLTRLDSADTQPLTDKEKEEIEKAKTTDLESLIMGSKDEESELNTYSAEEQPLQSPTKKDLKKGEKVKFDDIPF